MMKSIATLLVVLSFLALPTVVSAEGQIYVECGNEEPVLDLACQRAKLFDPSTDCQLLYCSGNTSGIGRTDLEDIVNVRIFNIFNVRLRVNSAQTVASLLMIGFSMFLGVVAIAATLYGVYGAVLRARATDSGSIATSQKIMVNAIIGIVLVVLSLVFAEMLANFLGIGSISNMVDITPVFADEPIRAT